jgi:hypothetical protein
MRKRRVLQLIIYGVLFFVSFFTHVAHAYLELVYTSKHMPMVESLNDGYPDGMIEETSKPSFRINFSATENPSPEGKIPLMLKNSVLEVSGQGNYYSPINHYLLPESSGYITRNSNGGIASWNFSLALKQIIPPTASPLERLQLELEEGAIRVESAYGIGTCNCDFYAGAFYHTYYQVRSDTYIRLSRAEKHWSDSNHPHHWQMWHADVSEPYSIVLAGLGLFALSIIRRRQSIHSHAPGITKITLIEPTKFLPL